MKFKGTKGKWFSEKTDGLAFIKNEDGKPILCILDHGLYDYGELPYNAKLISKAPEMLEMLENVLDCQSAENRLPVEINDEIRALIKKATEL